MNKLKHIGEYIVNPANIAYMSILTEYGQSAGTIIHFNAYAAAANETNSCFEPLSLHIRDLTPVQIMDFINDEPAF